MKGDKKKENKLSPGDRPHFAWCCVCLSSRHEAEEDTKGRHAKRLKKEEKKRERSAEEASLSIFRGS